MTKYHSSTFHFLQFNIHIHISEYDYVTLQMLPTVLAHDSSNPVLQVMAYLNFSFRVLFF